MDVLHHSVGHEQAELADPIGFRGQDELDLSCDARRIFGMNALEHVLSRRRDGAIVPVDREGFVGPEHLAGLDAPPERARVTESLRAVQIEIRSTERGLRLFCGGDVHHRADVVDPAGVVGYRVADDAHVPALAGVCRDSKFVDPLLGFSGDLLHLALR